MRRPSRLTPTNFALVVAAVVVMRLATRADAVDVRFTPSAREAYVNQAITLQIAIENATSFETPAFPKLAGAAVNPQPSQSENTMTQIINGRASTTKTVMLSYRIVPFQPGTITIPPITITADGQTFTSQPIEIIVSQSETGDLMFAEILSDRLAVYLGEPLRVRLRLWIKPFSDRQHNVRLNDEQMWSLIDPNATNWGDFAQVLAQRRGPFGSVTVPGEEVLRTDEAGNRGAYYQYEIESTIWPTQTGPIQLQQPAIVVNYPVRIARQTDFFSRSQFQIVDFRPISATPQPPPVEVNSPPTQGQPKTFNGAVGEYSISISARPTEVSVGDPITLTMTVIDQGDPQSASQRLNLLPAPPLDRVDELAENFRIPSDPLAGTVSGNTKVFTQTLRAKSDKVARIPPIPISFFDPTTETYTTRESEPLSISVKAGSQIGVNDIFASPSTATPQSRIDLKVVAGGILANYAAEPSLATAEPFRLNAMWVAILASPPLLFMGVALARTTSRFRQRNAPASRRRNAARRAIRMIKAQRSSDQRAQASAVLTAFSEYLSGRLNLPSRTFTSVQISSMLRENSVEPAVISETQEVLAECERLVYAPTSDLTQRDDLARCSLACIKKLERVRLK